MEQGAGISWSLVQTLKSSEQSSIEYSLPAHTFYLLSASSIASVSYGLLLVLPDGTVPSGSCIVSTRAHWPKGFFSCHLLMTSICNPRRSRCWQTWRLL